MKIGINCTHWVECAERILKDCLHAFSDPRLLLTGLHFSAMGYRTRCGFFKPNDNLRRGRFPTPAFACQSEDFGWFDIEADMVHGCKCYSGDHIALSVSFG